MLGEAHTDKDGTKANTEKREPVGRTSPGENEILQVKICQHINGKGPEQEWPTLGISKRLVEV